MSGSRSETFYIKSPEEMKKAFSYAPEAVTNTWDCRAVQSRAGGRQDYHLPHFDPPPEGSRGHPAWLSWRKKGSKTALPRSRPCAEPKASTRKNTATVWNSRSRLYRQDGISGLLPDRLPTSSAGPRTGTSRSVRAEARPPVRWWRIRSGSPISTRSPTTCCSNGSSIPNVSRMPDIDVDFCQDRRDEVIQYVADKYGHDRVCQIITFGTMGAKGSDPRRRHGSLEHDLRRCRPDCQADSGRSEHHPEARRSSRSRSSRRRSQPTRRSRSCWRPPSAGRAHPPCFDPRRRRRGRARSRWKNSCRSTRTRKPARSTPSTRHEICRADRPGEVRLPGASRT